MSLKNRIIGLAVVGAAALVLAPSALAKTASPSWACEAPSSPVFSAVDKKDDALYQLVEDGTFEDGASSWGLEGGAKVVRNTDLAFSLTGAANDNALEIGPGDAAVSPPICVTEDSESFRFVSNAVIEGAKDENLKVEVVYLRAKVKAKEIKSRFGRSEAAPKIKLNTGEFKQDASVRLRFTSLNDATVRIDDVYMDPRMH